MTKSNNIENISIRIYAHVETTASSSVCGKLCVLRDKIERHSIMHKSHEP